ncbi:hypothetical protein SAMN02745130_03736 [Thiothrix eikelboomii]|uniref:EF hand n=1 Tax=Thiothrix eikelboomii TaxID=92487 RepID=A0A1T4Y1N7_9GAMM|nr:hypothetical protein [Thiothrix eikelboomii]SKA95241.1 hypothetical protein SAMN02745130_03736 [Thiothrix eikelboomii]
MRVQTTAIVLFTSLLAISSTSFAKGGHNGSANHTGVSAKSSVFTAIYDTDGNGTVTTAEVTAVRTADFNEADGDDSATLSLAEYQNLETNTQTREISKMFEILNTDTTSSGLTLAEFSANTTATTAVTNAFALADTDGDSALSLAEFTVLQGYKTGSIWGFAGLDTDVSKTLTLTEFLAGRVGHGGKR